MKSTSLFARVIILNGALFLLHFAASAQQPAAPPDLEVNAETKVRIIDNLVKELDEGYVFPETAKKMGDDVRSRLKNKEYDAITSSRAFAAKLTANLQAISHDKHLRVGFSFQEIPIRKDKRGPTAEEIAKNERFMKRANYGFDRAERMDGKYWLH